MYEANKDKLFALASEHHGNIKLISDKASIPYNVVIDFYKNHEEFAKAVDEARDAFYDIAANKLAELINKGQMSAISLFFSKSPQARARGWGESSYVDQTNTNLTAKEKEEQVKKMLGLE